MPVTFNGILGVHGKNLPVKAPSVVTPADFTIGGVVGLFERKFNQAFKISSFQDFQTIFGLQTLATAYGYDTVKAFFDNVSGVQASLYVSSHVGYTGSALDAVVASYAAKDGTPATVLTIKAAYQNVLQYGTDGGNTGVTVTNGARFSTTCKTSGTKDDTFVILNSVSGIYVGDIMKFVSTGGGGATVYKKITSINYNTNAVNFSGAFHASANMASTDVATVLGFRLRVWRTSTTGTVTEVDTQLGALYCTTEPEVTGYYAPNVFLNSNWVQITRNATTPATLDKTLPVDVASVTYLTSGADGTAPTTAAHWSNALALMNNLPVRFLCNPESSATDIQNAGIAYCEARTDDNPIWIYTAPENPTQAQIIQIGQNLQVKGERDAGGGMEWLYVSNPFDSSIFAPLRTVPNVGFIIGAWIWSIVTNGIHVIPAVDGVVLKGCQGVEGDQVLDDSQRTTVAASGFNVIQNISGVGIVLRNLFMFSTSNAYLYGNGILMRNYIKISAIQSLKSKENQPNSIARVRENKMALINFGRKLWLRGSTGNVPEGETFGQFENTDGSLSKFEDSYQVRADVTNNPVTSLQTGNQFYEVYFFFPTPAGIIQIGTGILQF